MNRNHVSLSARNSRLTLAYFRLAGNIRERPLSFANGFPSPSDGSIP